MKQDRQESSRLYVSDEALRSANKLLHQRLGRAIEKHGRLGFMTTHEAAGALQEEVGEAFEALRCSRFDFLSKLLDCATVCIFAVSSYNEELLQNSGTLESIWGQIPETPEGLALAKLRAMATPGNGYPKGIREDAGATLAEIDRMRPGE